MSRARWCGVAFGLCGAFMSGICSAQGDPRFAIDRFEPSERGSEWFANESLDLRGALRPSLGVVSTYAARPFVVQNADGSIRRSPVRNLAALHAGGSLVLGDRVRLAVDLPFQLFADGHSAIANGRAFPAPSNEQGVSDLRFAADLRIFGQHRGVLTGAIGVQAWAPIGQQSQWASDDAWRVRPRAMLAGEIGLFVYAAQLSVGYRARSESFGSGAIGSDVAGAASAGLRWHDLVVGPEVFGSTVWGDAFGKGSTPVEALLGAHYLIADTARLGAGIGRGIVGGAGSPSARVFVSAEWAPGVGSDSDRDGIKDSEDACPHAAGIRTTNPRTNGCPTDRDGDGIVDAEDACVDVPGVRSNDPKTNGCPSDRDRDGIPDAEDACPDVRGPRTEDPRTNGCPVDSDRDGVADEIDACPRVPGIATNDPKTNGCPPDTDGDGIDDLADACPTVAGLSTSDPRTNGCPDPDRDKDGVPNEIDACPDEPGLPDPEPTRSGCPKAFVRGAQIQIRDQVKFKTGSADIVEKESAVLEAVLDVLTKHPDIKKVRVEGHTDNRGSPPANRALSAARAAAVGKWLVDHGVDKARLSSQGHGAERPIDTNETEVGRASNRRVELHIEP